MPDKWDKINEWRMQNRVSIRAVSQQMGIPYYALYHALAGKTEKMFDYHEARVTAWMKKNGL